LLALEKVEMIILLEIPQVKILDLVEVVVDTKPRREALVATVVLESSSSHILHKYSKDLHRSLIL
jgi:hypothetical protein